MSQHVIDSLIVAALQAGRATLRYFGHDIAVRTKSDMSPVTAADDEAEATILKILADRLPDLPVISEEAAAAGKYASHADRFALVDPLDGTKEFVSGRGDYTVNIAVIEGTAPLLGVVYAPARGELYFTPDPGQARAATVGPDTDIDSLSANAGVYIRTRPPPETGLVAVASRSHMTEETQVFLDRLSVDKVSNAGSSLKFCVVARGEADVYPRFGRTMEWDTAAGHAVLKAAGGTVLSSEGGELSYGKRPERYANPSFIAWGRAPNGAPLCEL